MEPEIIKSWAAILNALAWPIAAPIIAAILFILVLLANRKGGRFQVKIKEAKVLVEPA